MTSTGTGNPFARSAGPTVDREMRWVLVTCAALALLSFAFGLLSEGTAQDDDIGRFMNTRGALRHPEQFISLWNRPAFVVLYVLPAQLGYWAVELITAILAALTCFLVYRTARARAEENAWVAIPLVAFQPQFFLLSFSALVEPLAAFLVAASLDALYSGRHRRSAVYAALIPIARLELTAALGIWAIKYIRDGRWRSVALLPLGILAWGLAAALLTGEPLYLLDEIFTGEGRAYRPYGVWHYPSTLIFIVGPVVFSFLLVGLFRALRNRALDLVHYSFLLMLLVYIWLSWKSSLGQAAGFLRHFVALAPFSALIALEGLNAWLRGVRLSLTTLAPLLFAVLVTAAFLSRELIGGLYITGPAEYAKLAVVAIIALVAVVRGLPVLGITGRRLRRSWMIGLVIALSIAYLAAKRSPLPLTHEQKMIRSAATWCRAAGLSERITLCNHGWFRFYSTADHLAREQCPPMTMADLERAPVGAIAIWEGHYAPRLHGDVELEYFRVSRDWYVHRRFHRADGTGFFAVVLEKVDGRGARHTTAEWDRYENPALRLQMDLRHLGEWTFEPREKGQVLLAGAHQQAELQVILGFERFLGVFNDTRKYTAVIREELEANEEIELIDAAVARGGLWGRARFLWAATENAVWVSVSERQGTTLRVHFKYPPGQGERLEPIMTDLVESMDLGRFY